MAIGGYKGYGTIVMVDLLTGVFTDSNSGLRVVRIDQSISEQRAQRVIATRRSKIGS